MANKYAALRVKASTYKLKTASCQISQHAWFYYCHSRSHVPPALLTRNCKLGGNNKLLSNVLLHNEHDLVPPHSSTSIWQPSCGRDPIRNGQSW